MYMHSVIETIKLCNAKQLAMPEDSYVHAGIFSQRKNELPQAGLEPVTHTVYHAEALPTELPSKAAQQPS